MLGDCDGLLLVLAAPFLAWFAGCWTSIRAVGIIGDEGERGEHTKDDEEREEIIVSKLKFA